MRKTYTIHIPSKHKGKAPFVYKGASDDQVLECLAIHLREVTSAKQVFTVTLEDGTNRGTPLV